jgi:hypothetical protein
MPMPPVRALAAYKDFFTLRKDADPNIPILLEPAVRSAGGFLFGTTG